MKTKIIKFVKENKNNVTIGALSFVVVCFVIALLNALSHKVATVDVQTVVAKSSQVVVLKEEQKQKTEALQKWIEEAKKDVEKQSTKAKKDSLLKKYNAEFAQKQQELASEYVQKLQAIDKAISDIIAKEAKRQGYDMVAAKGVILYGADDITEQVAKKIQ